MTTTPRTLAGRTALITGATAGIGYYTATTLAAEGASLIITGRDLARGAAAVNEIRRHTRNDQVQFVPVDHMTVGANQDLAARLKDSYERLDILINNVGRVFSTREETADGYERSLALCFVGPAALTDSLGPLLYAGSSPRIVNIVSSAYKMWKREPLEDVQSRERFVGIQAHAHAKQLNLIWSFALSRTLNGQVTVVATNPGAAWTPGTQSLTPQAVPAWRLIWPIVRFFQRRASAENAAHLPAWLAASAEAAALTGVYVERRKRERPSVAADEENQRSVTELVETLIKQAPTART